ncbi:hypothetical protein FG167_08465 [Lacinutrix sp. WUR7]|uniref:hypothetical protein n=1 Tax=Lacinutrix sp. WUR7 TaxID=2653681 RepID=UPI00193E980C|nr:hypothetical protein [Lacinutrix sp. WUR7]QRM89263.1 hypothetical protein FG167_08465 [Lacinutrix sp. WUR7]
MKKQHLKNYLKFGVLLFGISFLLTNCEKESVEDLEYQQKSRFNVKTLNQEQVQPNSSISRKLNELNPKEKGKHLTNSQAREIYSSEYGFTINTDFVKYIEDTENGNHSYSFTITRDNQTDDKLENLLLHYNLENEYDAYIIQYGFTANEYISLDENSINNYSTLLFPIDFDTSVFNEGELAKMVYGCSETWEWVVVNDGDEGELNPNLGTHTMGWALTGISCGYFDNGPGGGGGFPSGTGSGGGGGSSGYTPPGNNYDPSDPNNHGNSNLPILTSPALPQNPPCTSGLNNLVNKPIANQTTPKTVIDNLNHLKNNLNQNKEMMYFMSPTTTAETEFVENYRLGLPNADEIQINLGTNKVSMLMHSHYSTTKHLSVFSLSDLYQIYTSRNAGNIFSPSTFTSIVVTAHGTTYAIKISDTQAFLNWGNTFFTGWDLQLPPNTNNPFIDAREDDYKLYVTKKQTNNKNEFGIANFFSKNNLGLELYKADSSFSNWSKITPNPNGTTTATPCQ